MGRGVSPGSVCPGPITKTAPRESSNLRPPLPVPPPQKIRKPGRGRPLQIRMLNAKTQDQIRVQPRQKIRNPKTKSQPARGIKRTLSGAVPVLGHCPRCRVVRCPGLGPKETRNPESQNLRLCPPPLAVTPAAFASDRASRSERLSGKARRPTACLRSKIPTLTPDAPLSGCRFAVIIQTARYKHAKSLLQTLLAGAARRALGKGP
jgi:hypothetical protein